jgi:uncharacterized protein YacL
MDTNKFANNMALWILRSVFLLVAAGVAAYIVNINRPQAEYVPIGSGIVFFILVMVGAVAIVAIDAIFPRKRLDTITSIYFGILVALFLTYAVSIALEPLLLTPDLQISKVKPIIQLLLAVAFSYICISLLLQTRDDFRFIIPYVEFAKEVKGLRPYLLDTSVIIDGRIADLAETNVLDNQLIMPRFVLGELQMIADSNDKLRRSRGRRGLDVLNKLRNNRDIDLKIHDTETQDMAGQPVDMKLVLLAKHLGGKIVTGDYNLNKVARIHNVPVINLNDIANSLKPVFLPGESLDVKIVKVGEEIGQGVGYLDDGTMIVVEGGREHVGNVVKVAVTSVLQTSAGRMIFGRFSGSGPGA